MEGGQKVIQILVGYVEPDETDKESIVASGSVTLVQTSDGHNIIVDCGSPWNAEEIRKGQQCSCLS